MARVPVMVLRAPGTNCDLETAWAWEQAGAAPQRVHIAQLRETPGLLTRFAILTIPGGFSYGDDIAAGRIFAFLLRRVLGDALRAHVERGGLVLGICNGFQVLVQTGLLPDVPPGAGRPACALLENDPPGFRDQWVRLRAADCPCPLLEPGREYELPIAHAEGRVVFGGPQVREACVAQRRIALRYVAGPPEGDGPANPNGSELDVAGLCDATGRVLGLMPHPERYVRATQHPAWTAGLAREPGDGLDLFARAVRLMR